MAPEAVGRSPQVLQGCVESAHSTLSLVPWLTRENQEDNVCPLSTGPWPTHNGNE